jgi:hypothetical protein
MQDFLKQPLAIGDHVILLKDHCRTFRLGQVVEFTELKVRIKIDRSYRETKLQDPHRLIKILPEQLVWYTLVTQLG